MLRWRGFAVNVKNSGRKRTWPTGNINQNRGNNHRRILNNRWLSLPRRLYLSAMNRLRRLRRRCRATVAGRAARTHIAVRRVCRAYRVRHVDSNCMGARCGPRDALAIRGTAHRGPVDQPRVRDRGDANGFGHRVVIATRTRAHRGRARHRRGKDRIHRDGGGVGGVVGAC